MTNKDISVPRERGQWVIDVCRTCGKQAKYPFCDHRDVVLEDAPWYELVVVSGTWHPKDPQ